MGYMINRIYLENYKLFDGIKLDFGNNLLSVFDGPNGYGKTSVFDAIEFLVTGNISRIESSEVILGTASYSTVFLAKDPKKDVLLKGEFIDRATNDTFIIGIRVKVAFENGKYNNPKKLLINAETFNLPSFDTPFESWDYYACSKEEMTDFRNDKFGEQNIKQFTLFHYIRQEDRLSFLKQKEKDRGGVIESIMGIQKELKKLDKAEHAQKDLQTKSKALEKQINEISQRLQKRPKSMLDSVEYISFFSGKYSWDVKDIIFQSEDEELLNRYFRDLDSLKAYIRYKPWHKIYQIGKIWLQIPADKRLIVIRAWLLLKKTQCSVTQLEEKKENLEYFQKQKNLIDEGLLLKISFLELCSKLNIEEIGTTLDAEVTSLKNLQSSQNELQKRILTIRSLRERMHAEVSKFEALDSCPYCGTTWKDRELLEEHYLEAEKTFKEFLDSDSEKYNLQFQAFRTDVINGVSSILNEKIENAKADTLLQLYCLSDNREMFATYINGCDKVMDFLKPNLELEESKDVEKATEYLFNEADCLYSKIGEDYYIASSEFNFELLTNTYFPDFVIPEIITEENIELKKRYLHKRYLQSFDELAIRLQKENLQKDKLDRTLGQLKEFVKALKTAISRYEKQIIDQIEIPFFIYSSRLLQSYQGGQGVLIDNNNGKSIKFIAPGSEHDVLYTMSSGQLSAVVLAFSLAMNKIYANEGIRTLFIDDPIQCMDDINIISFVELLRREFSDNQIIVSTHEEQFSNYIRYKFKKYNIETQAITLKDA